MTFIGNSVDPNATPQEDMGAIPAGEYNAIVIDSDMKPTKDSKGQYLELVYQILDGPLQGRKVWGRFNLENSSSKAVEIAQAQFAAQRVAVGLDKVQNSEELHNIPHVIRVDMIPAGSSIKKNGQLTGEKTQRDNNEIRGWKRIDGATRIAGAPGEPAQGSFPGSGAQAAATSAAAPARPGWSKPK